MDLGLTGASAGTVVVADSQTVGRGRLGRPWFSPPGSGLYFSIVLRPCLPVVELPKITLATGVAACKAIEKNCSLNPGLKWPNDLLLDTKKFGGILTETGPFSGEGKASAPLVIVGVGLNVNTSKSAFPPEIARRVTSLFIVSGKIFPRQALLDAMLNEIDATVAELEAGCFSSILGQWRSRDLLKGKTLTWLSPTGKEVLGEALGIGADGRYCIRDTAGVIHEVVSGDISLAGK